MIDIDLITRKMVLITRDLAALEPIVRKSLESYLASSVDEILVERYLERVIGRMIDINYHLLIESDQPPPADYYQSFTDLARLGVFDHEFSRQIAACSGLRNRIVHEYDELDPQKIHEALQTGLADISTYLRRINEHLARFRSD